MLLLISSSFLSVSKMRDLINCAFLLLSDVLNIYIFYLSTESSWDMFAGSDYCLEHGLKVPGVVHTVCRR